MKTIEIAGQAYSIKGELKNGAFYLEGPRGGNVVFAKPVFDQLSGANVYFFYKSTGGSAIHEKSGLIASASFEDLAA